MINLERVAFSLVNESEGQLCFRHGSIIYLREFRIDCDQFNINSGDVDSGDSASRQELNRIFNYDFNRLRDFNKEIKLANDEIDLKYREYLNFDRLQNGKIKSMIKEFNSRVL